MLKVRLRNMWEPFLLNGGGFWVYWWNSYNIRLLYVNLSILQKWQLLFILCLLVIAVIFVFSLSRYHSLQTFEWNLWALCLNLSLGFDSYLLIFKAESTSLNSKPWAFILAIIWCLCIPTDYSQHALQHVMMLKYIGERVIIENLSNHF